MDIEKTKIMIVDDSRVTRDLIKHLLSINPHIEIVATAENGVEALEYIKKTPPDVVLTDIVMPKMDGFELTKKIMEIHPMPIIVMSGVYNADEIRKSFDLFDAGVIAIMEKPRGIADEHFADTAKFIFDTARALSSIRVFKKNDIYEQPNKKIPAAAVMRVKSKNQPSGKINAIAIGSSIGGPKALQALLSPLPASLQIPIFIVQHISPGFVKGFADWLDGTTQLNVKIPEQNEQALPGVVYIAPDKYHMEIDPKGEIHLLEDTSNNLYVPSIDKLFQSVASSYGQNSLGVILLGAEKDGLKALQKIKEKGGFTMSETIELKKNPPETQKADVNTSIEEISNIITELVTP